MQLKINRRCNIIITAFIVMILAGIVGLVLTQDMWQDNRVLVIAIFACISTVFLICFKYYEVNADRKIISRMVANGDIALAEIKGAKFERIIKDSNNHKYPIWKLDIVYYDRDNNKHSGEMYEKFDASQTKVPHGYVYITSDENRPDYKFIIPNMLLQIYDGAEDMIKKYESSVKDIRYLNAYYHKGIVVETFKKSLNKARELKSEE